MFTLSHDYEEISRLRETRSRFCLIIVVGILSSHASDQLVIGRKRTILRATLNHKLLVVMLDWN